MKDRILNTDGFKGHSKKITMYNLLREIYDNSKTNNEKRKESSLPNTPKKIQKLININV